MRQAARFAFADFWEPAAARIGSARSAAGLPGFSRSMENVRLSASISVAHGPLTADFVFFVLLIEMTPESECDAIVQQAQCQAWATPRRVFLPGARAYSGGRH
jgi:hypothetical protein